jgi:MoaA/NifB/PqqE/SkfB family radical SAM enzyme
VNPPALPGGAQRGDGAGGLRDRTRWFVRDFQRAELFGSWRLRGLLARDAVSMRLRGDGVPPPRPRLVQIEPTRACNLRCPMCLRTGVAGGTPEMSFPLFREIVDRNFDYMHFLLLYGQGEPLLCRDLFDMIRYEHARGRWVVTVTNGTLLDAAACAEVASSGLDLLRISIDAATPETCSRVRPGVRLDQVLGNVERLRTTLARRRAPTRLAVTCMALPGNYRDLAALVDVVAGLGIHLLEIKEVPPYLDEPAPSLTLRMRSDPELRRDVGRVLADVRQRARRRHVQLVTARLGNPHAAHACRNPWYKCFVAADGRVSPCSKLCLAPEAEVGRLPQQSLQAVWSGAAYRRIRRCIEAAEPPFAACRTHRPPG